MKFLNLDSISKKLTLMILFAVMPCLAILLYSGIELRQHLIEDAKSNVLLITNGMAIAQKEITQSTKQILTTLSQLPSIQATDPNAGSAILKAVLKQNSNFINVALVDLKGDVLASGKPFTKTNLADRKHVKEALGKHEFAAGEYIVTRVGTANPAFAFAYPVLDKEGRPRAILTAVVKLDIFSRFYDVSTLPEKAFVAVTDYKGTRLFYYPAQDNTNPIGKPIGAKAWNTATKGEEHGLFFGTGSDGLRRIFAYEKVRLNQEDTPYLYVWAGIPEDYILKAANYSLFRNLLIMFLGTVISLFISWMIGKNTLISPIQSLVALTRKFARGDLEARSELTINAGEVGMLTKSFYDMAESLAMSRRTLQENEEKFRSMMEAMKDPIYICSPDFQVEYMNPAMIKRVGHDATGEFCFKCLHDLNEKCAWCQHDIIQHGIISEFDIVSPKDNRSYSLSQTPIVHWDESISQMTVFKDITELRRMEEQFRQAQKMESVGRLAGGVAHDFNNALSVIRGFTEFALEDADPKGQLHEDLTEVLLAATRATDITRQLLAFARKQIISPKVLDLNEIVESMLKMLRRLIGEDIDLSWLPGANLWSVKMDPSQIDQILVNLCVNARDAIEDVGKITIETNTVIFDSAYCAERTGFIPGDFVLLAVSDNGCGMDKEVLDNIFEPFFTTKDVDKGTGLGLATVYGIVKQNKGFINVYSEPGKGTTIKIYLSRHEGQEVESQEESTTNIPIGSGETILIVEDDLSILKLVGKTLKELGYTVLAAGTPVEAMTLARKYPSEIHLVVTDVIMPEMNGRELSEQLQSQYPGLKCIFMSGYTANAIAHHGVLDEGMEFIQKPFSKTDLATIVRKALEEDKN